MGWTGIFLQIHLGSLGMSFPILTVRQHKAKTFVWTIWSPTHFYIKDPLKLCYKCQICIADWRMLASVADSIIVFFSLFHLVTFMIKIGTISQFFIWSHLCPHQAFGKKYIPKSISDLSCADGVFLSLIYLLPMYFMVWQTYAIISKASRSADQVGREHKNHHD